MYTETSVQANHTMLLVPAEAVLEDGHQTEDNEDNYSLLDEEEKDEERNESKENEVSSQNHLLSNTQEKKIEDLEEDHVYHILEGPGGGDHENADEKEMQNEYHLVEGP